ncbi:MAG: PQQ-binding-like beta-propeller repeat protein [Phycisphaerales bacterium]|nr:MAG: PQQ-binding-like beta-propeller repeat protein [Phycisphaerales bacterium]
MQHLRALVAAIAPAFICLGSSGVRGEEDEVLRLGDIRDTASGAEVSNIYLNDSLEASDAIAKAGKLADAGRWTEAAELLRQTLESAGDGLVRVSKGRYVGIRAYINDIICTWPQEGLDAYRARHERDTISALEASSGSRDLQHLLNLFDQHFCTAAAARFADTIAQLAIEAGDLTLARRVYQRVLVHHPDGKQYDSRYRAMLVVLSIMLGDSQVDLTSIDADTTIRFQGSDRPVQQVVAELRDSFAGLHQEIPPEEWPVFGGGPERNRTGESTVDELGLLWRSDVFKPAGTAVEEDDFVEDDDVGAGPDDGRALSIQPVVSGDLVFVQRCREIIALHLNSGVVAWRFRADDAPEAGYNELASQPSRWDSVTIHDNRVYAALPGDIIPYYGYESAQSAPELVCLGAATGTPEWRSDNAALAKQPSELSFDSSPVIAHGRLYVVGRRRRSFGFEDCYLYCLSAVNGRMIFRSHLGSASTGTFGTRQPTLTMVTLEGDTAYVCSNLGSIAAVSAHTGAVRWLRLYDRKGRESHTPDWHSAELAPWAFNPILFDSGRLICLPVAASSVLMLAADDGRLIRSIPCSELGSVETLLGVKSDILCTAGEEVSCYDLSKGERKWSAPLPTGASLHGRGLWVGGRVVIPTRSGLVGYDVADGTRSEATWGASGTGGNLLALPDQLLVAGGDSITAYVHKAELWNALRSRMAAYPSDPLPALELAEVAFRGAEFDEAFKVLDEAVRRAGGFLEAIEPSLKRRFFDDILMFVDVLSGRSLLDESRLETLFNLVSQCPPDTAAHLRYRLEFAGLYEQAGQPAKALSLYHQVLRDRSLRELALIRRGDSSDLRGVNPEDKIAELIQRNGKSIYAAYEAQAQRRLEMGQDLGDVDVLSQVVETFPNSDAAPRALIAHGELLVKAGNPGEAAGLFSRAYHRFPRHVNRPELIRKIADAFEQAGRAENAYRWLTKAAREHPGVTTDYKGKSISFLEYRKRLIGLCAKVEPARPQLALPLEKQYDRKFDGPVALLAPRFADHPACRWRRYFVSTDQTVRAFHAATNAEAWPEPFHVRGDAELLIATDESAIFATLYEVFAVDVSTGTLRWSHSDYPENVDDGLADWENGERYRTHALQGNRLVSVRDNGEMSCVAVDSGEMMWSETHRPTPIGPVEIGDMWIAYHVTQDGKAVIVRVDALTGEWISATATEENRPTVGLYISLDGQVILVTTQSLAAYDPETGVQRWRVLMAGHPRPGSLALDIDALYLSDDGQRLRKISLEDGHTVWQTERLARRGADGFTVHRQAGSVIISTASMVSAVDEVTGLTLWRGTTPDQVSFAGRMLTQAYVVAVDVPDEFEDAQAVAYFYDHRNASGVIPRVGGACTFGGLSDVRAILVCDGALLVQDGMSIIGWTH